MHLESLQSLALAVAAEHSVETVLKKIVEGLAEQPDVALARIWLIGSGDICDSCPMQSECPDQTRCLHLAASEGRSNQAGTENWSRLDGEFRRMPLGVRKVGRIGATGEPMLLKNITTEREWIADPEWAERESIHSFAGQPLIFRDEILGVLALFSRAPLDEGGFTWLRMFADQAAVAIVNARAFEEIERLRQQLELENVYLREEVEVELSFGEIVGQSAALKKALEQIELVAPTDMNVLITGETGTGKELVARAIHERSQRRDRPLIKVNCGAVPRDLFESEFFGHIKGAFTGAMKDRAGRFQLADHGTLFLDEVGEIPLELQSKLLRVLQEGQFERVGEDITRHVDARIMAATNRDLKREVEAGRFREDLYYRLSVFPIQVPPLRERKEDIPLLAAHFINCACKRLNCVKVRLSAQDIAQLQKYDWPGNVRELQNVIERAVVSSRGGLMKLEFALPTSTPDVSLRLSMSPDSTLDSEFVPMDEWKRRERDNILAALRQTNWKIYGPGGAAELLGVKPTTLAYRLKALGIKKPR